ncbi:hypothetical protein BJ322DRAFT_1059487 [Thelephora terrestris]|uniref:Uncharacterized protein n=1 Tax=Thelephora terrestris TaxID=56493 RepID=A0A9P6HGI6_9AGAM|nr:hypothetical protein BJ322DRAFT_1059487 [Thelephora terrestris]
MAALKQNKYCRSHLSSSRLSVSHLTLSSLDRTLLTLIIRCQVTSESQRLHVCAAIAHACLSVSLLFNSSDAVRRCSSLTCLHESAAPSMSSRIVSSPVAGNFCSIGFCCLHSSRWYVHYLLRAFITHRPLSVPQPRPVQCGTCSQLITPLQWAPLFLLNYARLTLFPLLQVHSVVSCRIN